MGYGTILCLLFRLEGGRTLKDGFAPLRRMVLHILMKQIYFGSIFWQEQSGENNKQGSPHHQEGIVCLLAGFYWKLML